MTWLLCLPFVLQSILIGIDEWYFHIKRGLPKWERIGHPIDTLTLIACLVIPFILPFSKNALVLFIALSALSCLMVTKDEFVHKHHCPAAENWLHALLFINHPLILTSTGLMWTVFSNNPLPFLIDCLPQASFLRNFLLLQCGIACAFMLYQIIYWNYIWKEKPQE
jgi:hypothetical protein